MPIFTVGSVMVHQSPLAYMLGLEGVALMRAFAGDHDQDFCEARIAEIRRLLDSPSLSEGVLARRVESVDGYRVWSATYDRPRNGLFDIDEPIVHEILGPLPPGTALDAACGTGRYAEYLAAQGHRVIGVDSSPDMLAHAGTRVPAAEFRHGDLDKLPLPDDHVDIVVCALALTHLLPAHRHRVGDYLGAALPLGLQVRRCDEPRMSGGQDSAPMRADARRCRARTLGRLALVAAGHYPGGRWHRLERNAKPDHLAFPTGRPLTDTMAPRDPLRAGSPHSHAAMELTR